MTIWKWKVQPEEIEVLESVETTYIQLQGKLDVFPTDQQCFISTLNNGCRLIELMARSGCCGAMMMVSPLGLEITRGTRATSLTKEIPLEKRATNKSSASGTTNNNWNSAETTTVWWWGFNLDNLVQKQKKVAGRDYTRHNRRSWCARERHSCASVRVESSSTGSSSRAIVLISCLPVERVKDGKRRQARMETLRIEKERERKGSENTQARRVGMGSKTVGQWRKLDPTHDRNISTHRIYNHFFFEELLSSSFLIFILLCMCINVCNMFSIRVC